LLSSGSAERPRPHGLKRERHTALIAKRGWRRSHSAGQGTCVGATPPNTLQALLADPDRTTRRDYAWILLAFQTGLRACELTSLTCAEVHLGADTYLACHGNSLGPMVPLMVVIAGTDSGG
jgi:hypothetical protein